MTQLTLEDRNNFFRKLGETSFKVGKTRSANVMINPEKAQEQWQTLQLRLCRGIL